MNDFLLVMVAIVVLTFTNILSFVHGLDEGASKAIATICGTKKVVCKVPDVEIKIP